MLIVSYTSDAYMKFIYMPFSSNDMYIRTKAGEWLPWQSINDFKDTGWINLPLVNGAYANTEYTDRNGYPCSYRIVTQNGVTTNHLRINASNLLAVKYSQDCHKIW